MVYGFAASDACPLRNRSAGSGDAWQQCQDDNLVRIGTFVGIGVATMAGGALAWYLIRPSSLDFATFVDEHNRRSPRPLRWDVGYDPKGRFAFGQATFTL
jgi:hypothetical protein